VTSTPGTHPLLDPVDEELAELPELLLDDEAARGGNPSGGLGTAGGLGGLGPGGGFGTDEQGMTCFCWTVTP
jgi:hypothetical protein